MSLATFAQVCPRRDCCIACHAKDLSVAKILKTTVGKYFATGWVILEDLAEKRFSALWVCFHNGTKCFRSKTSVPERWGYPVANLGLPVV
jgi:hypothetical protein